jgi:hypothetical protein
MRLLRINRSLLPTVVALAVVVALGSSPPLVRAGQPSPDDLATVAGVPWRLPTSVPDGYRLRESGRLGHALMPDVDIMLLTYRNGAGDFLHVIQGWPVSYDDESYQRAPAKAKGSTTVQDQPALWVRAAVPLPGPGLDATSAEPLSLRWRSGEQTSEGEPVGYAVQADALTLDVLLAIAGSLQPYAQALAAGGPVIPIPTRPVRPQPATPDPRVPAAVWGLAPTLGDVPGERFLGRLMVEAGIGVVATPSEARDLARRAADALDGAIDFPLTGAPWPDLPIMRPDAPPGAFRGRVVVELWERSVLIAVTPTTVPVGDLVAEAIEVLRTFPP